MHGRISTNLYSKVSRSYTVLRTLKPGYEAIRPRRLGLNVHYDMGRCNVYIKFGITGNILLTTSTGSPSNSRWANGPMEEVRVFFESSYDILRPSHYEPTAFLSYYCRIENEML